MAIARREAHRRADTLRARTGRAACLRNLLSALLLAACSGVAAAGGLGDMLGALAGSPGDYARGRDLDEALQRLANQMNRGMPRTIDNQFRLDRVTAEPGSELVYHYTLLGRSAAAVPPDVLNTRMAPAVRERLCVDPHMKKLLKSGAAVGFSYRGNDGGEIGKLSFRQRDCAEQG